MTMQRNVLFIALALLGAGCARGAGLPDFRPEALSADPVLHDILSTAEDVQIERTEKDLIGANPLTPLSLLSWRFR